MNSFDSNRTPWLWSGDTLNEAQSHTKYMKIKTKMINLLKCLQYFIIITYFISMLNQAFFSCLMSVVNNAETTTNGVMGYFHLFISQLMMLTLVLAFYYICGERWRNQDENMPAIVAYNMVFIVMAIDWFKIMFVRSALR